MYPCAINLRAECDSEKPSAIPRATHGDEMIQPISPITWDLQAHDPDPVPAHQEQPLHHWRGGRRQDGGGGGSCSAHCEGRRPGHATGTCVFYRGLKGLWVAAWRKQGNVTLQGCVRSGVRDFSSGRSVGA